LKKSDFAFPAACRQGNHGGTGGQHCYGDDGNHHPHVGQVCPSSRLKRIGERNDGVHGAQQQPDISQANSQRSDRCGAGANAGRGRTGAQGRNDKAHA